jgi:hypothetical protein
VLSTKATGALTAAIGAVGALKHSPGAPTVVAEVHQARAALRELTPNDPMAHVIDRLLVEVIACRLASKRYSPQLGDALQHALVLARAMGQRPTATQLGLLPFARVPTPGATASPHAPAPPLS